MIRCHYRFLTYIFSQTQNYTSNIWKICQRKTFLLMYKLNNSWKFYPSYQIFCTSTASGANEKFHVCLLTLVSCLSAEVTLTPPDSFFQEVEPFRRAELGFSISVSIKMWFRRSAADFHFAFWPNKDSSFMVAPKENFLNKNRFFGALPLYKTATTLKPGKNVNDRRSTQWAWIGNTRLLVLSRYLQ